MLRIYKHAKSADPFVPRPGERAGMPGCVYTMTRKDSAPLSVTTEFTIVARGTDPGTGLEFIEIKIEA
jgi:hypothetical protein